MVQNVQVITTAGGSCVNVDGVAADVAILVRAGADIDYIIYEYVSYPIDQIIHGCEAIR